VPTLTPGRDDLASWRDHVIVCGLHDEGLRVTEQLHAAGIAVVMVDDAPDQRLVGDLEALGVPVLAADSRRATALEAAGLAGATALICAESDDLHTLATALAAREAGGARIVVQLRNPAVGRALEGIGVAVLDVAALAAPTFVEASLGMAARSLALGGEEFEIVDLAVTRPGTLRDLFGDLAPLAVREPGGDLVVTPGRDVRVEPGDSVVLVGTSAELAPVRASRRTRPEHVFIGARAPRPDRNRPAALLRVLAGSLDRRLKAALLGLLVLVATSVGVLMAGYREPDGTRMSVVDALYFTVETVGTVGFGDFYFRDQYLWLRIWAIGLMIVGAALATVFFALLTNMLVSRRIAESLGLRRITGMSEHVVVVGAGSVGLAVVEGIQAHGGEVVVIERDEENRFVGRLRALGVPVVIADATLPETLRSAQLDRARSVVLATSDDLVNIETGLAVRDLLGTAWERVPVVLRLFDRRLAGTVASGFGFRHVRSPAALAAPWFVGAALGLDVLATFYVEAEPLLVARFAVSPGSALAGRTMREVAAAVRVVSLLRADGSSEHSPRRGSQFAAGDTAYVIGPYEALISLLRAA
jgi:Trk K+ transport system NAD-binding subunit